MGDGYLNSTVYLVSSKGNQAFYILVHSSAGKCIYLELMRKQLNYKYVSDRIVCSVRPSPRPRSSHLELLAECWGQLLCPEEQSPFLSLNGLAALLLKALCIDFFHRWSLVTAAHLPYMGRKQIRRHRPTGLWAIRIWSSQCNRSWVRPCFNFCWYVFHWWSYSTFLLM